MDFILSWNNREGVLIFPVVPNEAIVLNRDQKNEVFESVNGEMQALGTLGLASFELESFFPRNDYPFIRPGGYRTAWDFVRAIEAVRARRIPFRAVHLDNEGREIFNLPVSVDSFEYWFDQAGDISYRLKCTEYRFANQPLSATLPAQEEPEGRIPTEPPAPITMPLTDSQAADAEKLVPSGSGTTIVVPESANQGGMTGNFTWYHKQKWDMTLAQGKLYKIWIEQGRPSQSGVAMISGMYCVAMTTKFGQAGDMLQINLENGDSFKAIMADSKGANPGVNPHPGESGNEWGHSLLYPGRGWMTDVVEWEAYNGDPHTLVRQKGWTNVKVASVVNLGPAQL